MNWKRRLESWVVSQTAIVKISLAILCVESIILGSIALAQATPTPTTASSFEVFRSIRTAEAAVKASPALPDAHRRVMVAGAFDMADDYIKELFGSQVPNRTTAAEAALNHPLGSPLPANVIDNGAAPLPPAMQVAKATPAGGLFSSRNLLWPMRGGLVSSRFGMRWGRMHQGTDISAPYGTPILAAGDGKVVFSGWEGGYGKLVILDHGNGVKTKYGHCSQLLVSTGQFVRQGEVLGKVGSTGHSTGPHLHYEVVRGGRASNPESLTRRR